MTTYTCLNCGTESKISHQKTNKYCSTLCHKEHQYKQNIDNWLQGNDLGGNKYGTRVWVKRYILEQQEYKCLECGIIEHNSKPINLELDHIDGNPYNNKVDNLRCICPNCHSQSSSYKNKNKGSGRHYRRDRYANGESY